MPAQPSNSSQNVGLIVLIVGIFMVVFAFVAVAYFNANKIDSVKTTQNKNSQVSKAERSNILDVTCALWRSIGNPGQVEPSLRASVEAICSDTTPTPTP